MNKQQAIESIMDNILEDHNLGLIREALENQSEEFFGIKDNRKFKVSFSVEVSGEQEDKELTMDSLTEENGFNDDDRLLMLSLKVGDKLEETTPNGVGITLTRVE